MWVAVGFLWIYKKIVWLCTFCGALMTPMLYPNCRDPRTAVKTERTKVPVTVCSWNIHKHIKKLYFQNLLLLQHVYDCDPDGRYFSWVHNITERLNQSSMCRLTDGNPRLLSMFTSKYHSVLWQAVVSEQPDDTDRMQWFPVWSVDYFNLLYTQTKKDPLCPPWSWHFGYRGCLAKTLMRDFKLKPVTWIIECLESGGKQLTHEENLNL